MYFLSLQYYIVDYRQENLIAWLLEHKEQEHDFFLIYSCNNNDEQSKFTIISISYMQVNMHYSTN